MIDVKEAYEIVKSNNPGMKAYICNETKQYYEFALAPSNLAKGDAFANSVVYLVDKNTKKYEAVHFKVVMEEPILREIDTTTLE